MTTRVYFDPAPDRKLHVSRDCPSLQQSGEEPETALARDAPRREVCDNCARDQTLADLAPDRPSPDADAVAECVSCGTGIVPETTNDWDRTPQGRRKCPECGTIAPEDQHDPEREVIA